MSLVGIVFDGECGRRFFIRACKNFEDVDTEHYVVGPFAWVDVDDGLFLYVELPNAMYYLSLRAFCISVPSIDSSTAARFQTFQTSETGPSRIHISMATTTESGSGDILDPSNSSKNTLKLENVSCHIKVMGENHQTHGTSFPFRLRNEIR